MFFIVIEFIVIAVLMTGLLTQVIIPAIKGRTLFPTFRKQGKLEKVAAEVRQKVYEEKLKSNINELKKGKKNV